MNRHASFADSTFTENGPVDVTQLNALYRLIGWDSDHRRTEPETTDMLRVSHYYMAAHTHEGTLVGSAPVCGDAYVAQVLDVITHPAYRRRGLRPERATPESLLTSGAARVCLRIGQKRVGNLLRRIFMTFSTR